ncbi:MAG: fibrobacter succinogenes major paralogous domain-containing protein [Dysgonamonadaceae bacterium]|jgi:uncharacterized protein (TIGR02145 family)|nr:fibrobacter succinogenes major paralogous domain-containing protein [Dysgonamonadaceae bacterium]
MKTILLTMTALFMLSANCAFAQVTIGELKDPESFSILELVSTSGGLRLPQMSNANKIDAFGTNNATLIDADVDALGLQIFNIDTKCVETWNGTEWIAACFTCPSGQVSDYECNCYTYAEFGDAGTWMTQNLRSTKYLDGTTEITLQIGSDIYRNPNDKFYNYPDIDGTNPPTDAKFKAHPEYGLLYSWAAASGRTNVSTADTDGVGTNPDTDATKHQGICPKGWHLPSDYEWTQLVNEIANNNTNNKYGTGSDIGHNIRSQTAVIGTDIADPDGTSNTPANNGFNALLVGFVYDGQATDYGLYANFWSSSSYTNNRAWYRDDSEGETGVGIGIVNRAYLFSVRCKKNE